MKVITFSNNKGGVAKTTSATAVAHLLSTMGRKVLLIDTDPQGNASARFGYYQGEALQLNFADLIFNRISGSSADSHPITDFIQHNDEYKNLDIIISNSKSLEVQIAMTTQPGTDTVMLDINEELKALNKYDYVVIDTAPALDRLLAAIFLMTDIVLIPIICNSDSGYALNTILNFMEKMKKLNRNLTLGGAFFVMAKNNTKAFRDANDMFRQTWGEYILKTFITATADVNNAINDDKGNICVTKKFSNHRIAKEYMKLIKEVIEP